MADDLRVENLGEHRFLLSRFEGDELVEIEIYANPTAVERIGLDGVDEERIIQAAAGFLLERQRADELPGKVDLDDVVAAYDGFIDEMRKRVSH
ncbi:MAG TPA: hypothetical protein VHT50_27940 [Mycobacterium sp.]|nr:hypothetical protein [Mycobacterium sp.]